jgi:hypothetical protein
MTKGFDSQAVMVDRETTRVRRRARKRSALDTTTVVPETDRVVQETDTTESASIKQTVTPKKEEETMAERDANTGLTDIANSIVSTLRDIAARSIDTNVSFAKQMLDFQAQTTSWAKDTPLGAMFQSQYALGEGLIELFADAARAMWRIEKAKSDS